MHRRSILATLVTVNLVFATVLMVMPGVEDEQEGNGALAATVDVPEFENVVIEEPALTEAFEQPSRECRIWGPQETERSFSALKSRLEESGALPQIFKVELKGRGDKLVLVRGLASAKQARDVAKELSALGIETYVMMREAEPVLSVGVFSKEKLAQAQYSRVRELGYEASIEAFGLGREVFSLRAHVESSDPAYTSSVGPCPTFAQGS